MPLLMLQAKAWLSSVRECVKFLSTVMPSFNGPQLFACRNSERYSTRCRFVFKTHLYGTFFFELDVIESTFHSFILTSRSSEVSTLRVLSSVQGYHLRSNSYLTHFGLHRLISSLCIVRDFKQNYRWKERWEKDVFPQVWVTELLWRVIGDWMQGCCQPHTENTQLYSLNNEDLKRGTLQNRVFSCLPVRFRICSISFNGDCPRLFQSLGPWAQKYLRHTQYVLTTSKPVRITQTNCNSQHLGSLKFRRNALQHTE